MKKILVLLLFSTITLFSQTNCLQPIDFTDWIVLGDPSYGNWDVSPDGTSVQQLNNGEPTFLAWNESLINYRIEGDVIVNTTIGDEDFLGAAFGVKLPNQIVFDEYKMWLFDWKRDTQLEGGCDMFGEAGFSFNKIDGSIPVGCDNFETRYYFWSHHDDNTFDVLDTKYGLDHGWEPYVSIHLTLEYTLKGAMVMVDNDTIFMEHGCFDTGYFALYNYSQDHVIYKDFTYSFRTGFVIEPEATCLGDSSNMILMCSESIDFDLTSIDTVKWDFGDGNNLTVTDLSFESINPTHLFELPGVYNVQLIVIDNSGCTDTAYASTIIWDSLSLNIPDTILCSGANFDVDLQPDVTAVWWDNSTTLSKSFTEAGVYWVEITRGPCIVRDSFIVVTDGLPILNIGPSDTIICNSEELLLNANSINGISYLWQDNSIGETYNVASTGVYSVVATNFCGTSTDQITVDYFTPSDYFISDFDLCTADNSINTLSFPEEIDILWSDGTTDNTKEFTDAGVYWVSIGMGPCVEIDTFEIIGHVFPSFDLGTPTLVVCNTDTLILNANAPNGISYLWQDNSTGETFEVTEPGIYSVTVSNYCGDSFDQINIGYFTASDYFIDDFILCAGDTHTIVMPIGVDIIWYDNTNNIAKEFTQPGTYWVSIGKGSCIESDTFVISEETLPFFDFGPRDTTLCFGETIELDAFTPNGTSIEWSTSEQGNQLMVSSEGVYIATVSNICGSYSDTIDVIYLSDEFGFEFGFDDTLLCADVSLYLDYPFGEATNYNWSTGDESSDVSIDDSGTYWLTISNHCISESDTFNVLFEGDSPIVALEYINEINCNGNTAIIEGIVLNSTSYSWNTADTGLIIEVTEPGSYILTGVNVCGQLSQEAIIEYQECSDFTLPNIFSPNGDQLNDYFGPFDVNTEITNFKFVVYDRWGSPVFTTTDIRTLWDGKKDGTVVPPDVYIYVINYTNFNDENKTVHGDVTVAR